MVWLLLAPDDGESNLGQFVQEVINGDQTEFIELNGVPCGGTVYTLVYRCQAIYTATFLRWGESVLLLRH